MEKLNLLFASKTVELSEHPTYLELLNRVCYYDDQNLNGVMLPFEGAEEKAKTLIDMPVKAKYLVDATGNPDLGGHEAAIDQDGDIVFLTERVGTHTEVYIKDDLVEINGALKTLPCLFAKMKIWTENKNVVAAVKRLYSENKLHNSWEIISNEYLYTNGVKKLIDYVFSGNALLGTGSFPAYGKSAKVLSLSAEDKECELLIASSLSKDLSQNKSDNSDISTHKTKEGEEDLSKKEKATEIEVEISDVESTEETEASVVEDTTENIEQPKEEIATEEVEVSDLTVDDLRRKIQEACRMKLGGCWVWIAFHFPIERKVWAEIDCRASELDYKMFTYEVNDDVVTVSDPVDVKLSVSIAEINSTIETLNSEITEKNSALLKANETIQTLSTEVSNLSPFKEKFEEAEQIRIAEELKANQEKIKAYAMKTKLISESELEDDEIRVLIESVDYATLDKIILDRFIASLESDTIVEIAEVTKEVVKEVPRVNLTSSEDKKFSPGAYIASYINRK